jgi:hypothetical protein
LDTVSIFLFLPPILTLGCLGIANFHLSYSSWSIRTCWDIVVSMLPWLCSFLNKSISAGQNLIVWEPNRAVVQNQHMF